MSPIGRRSLRTPDERETYPLGEARAVHLGEQVVARTLQEPGWRWSTHVKPIVGTPSCMFHHMGVVLSGRIRWRLDDGSEAEFGPDDVFDIPPGHDAWVVGDLPCETIDWVGAHRWATAPAGERILATLLFTDIVDSTAVAEQMGDRAWTALVEEHNQALRGVLDRSRGREIATTGDGMLAMFDGAERAVRAAAACHDAVRELAVTIRVSVHTGEVEVVPGNVRGVALHVAARILALAGPGEVLVSSTTRELLVTDDLHFEDRGAYELRGLTGARTVFALAQ